MLGFLILPGCAADGGVICPANLKAKFDGHLLDGGQRVRVIDVIKDPKARKSELKHANVFIQVGFLWWQFAMAPDSNHSQ